MQTLLDTALDEAVQPELLQEVTEVLDLVYPGQGSSNVNVRVLVEPEPATLTVQLVPQAGFISSATPRHVAAVYAGTYSVQDNQWSFQKAFRATCACGEIMDISSVNELAEAAQAHAESLPAGAGSSECVVRCTTWVRLGRDALGGLACEDKPKALIGLLAASLAGYSDPALYDLGLSPELATAFDEVSKAVLEDESLFTLTAFVRPVRPPESSAASQGGAGTPGDAAATTPAWLKAAAAEPLTQWCLSQPWYLQYVVSRGHPGVKGGDVCLPARRAASRVRSGFAAMEQFDALPYEEQSGATLPTVTVDQVTAELAALLERTRDFRTPEQFCRRLGVTLAQLTDLVNLKEVGSLAIDMCCRCGIFVVDNQPAVACEHCVDVYHLQCQGLRAVPEGDWICPGCTLASGATGRAAASAVARATNRRAGAAANRAARAAAAAAAANRGRGATATTGAGRLLSPTGDGGGRTRSRGAGGAGAAPARLSPLVVGGGPGDDDEDADLDEADLDEGEETEEDEPLASGGRQAGLKRARSAGAGAGGGGGGSGGGGSRERKPVVRSRYTIFRVDASEATHYVTNVPGLPNPTADGRSLCLRMAAGLLGRGVAPPSKKWRPEVMLHCNLLAGIHCEYHQVADADVQRVTLSEATLAHGGIKCNRCRRCLPAVTIATEPPQPPPPRPIAEGTGPQPMHEDGPPQPPPPAAARAADGPPQPPPPRAAGAAAGKPLAHTPHRIQAAQEVVQGRMQECGRMFKHVHEYEQHLRAGTPSPTTHIWLPKHRIYMQGVPGIYKGLVELSRSDAQRHTMFAEQLATLLDTREQARCKAMEEAGLNPDQNPDFVYESGDDWESVVPPPSGRSRPRSGVTRLRSVAHGSGGAPQPPPPAASVGPPQPPVRAGSSRPSAGAPPAPPAKKEPPPALPGFDPETLERERRRVKAMMAMQLSEAKVLAQLPCAGPAVDADANGSAPAAVQLQAQQQPAAAAAAVSSGGAAPSSSAAGGGGAALGGGGLMMQLVRVVGVQGSSKLAELYILVPKQALDAVAVPAAPPPTAQAAEAGGGSGGGTAAVAAAENGHEVAAAGGAGSVVGPGDLEVDGMAVAVESKHEGIPVVPAGLLPYLLARGGAAVLPVPPQGVPSAAKVRSIKVLRRLSALRTAAEAGAGATQAAAEDAADELTRARAALTAAQAAQEAALAAAAAATQAAQEAAAAQATQAAGDGTAAPQPPTPSPAPPAAVVVPVMVTPAVLAAPSLAEAVVAAWQQAREGVADVLRVLGVLRACRERAEEILDPAVQYECLGFVEDVLAQLEGVVGAVVAAAEAAVAPKEVGPASASLGAAAAVLMDQQQQAVGKVSAVQAEAEELLAQLQRWAALAQAQQQQAALLAQSHHNHG